MSYPEAGTAVPKRMSKHYVGPICSQAEVQQTVAELRQREGCIDASEHPFYAEAYFEAESHQPSWSLP